MVDGGAVEDGPRGRRPSGSSLLALAVASPSAATAPHPIPAAAVEAEVGLYYQSLTRHYVEALRDGDTTDDRGEVLYELWEKTGRGAPILMAQRARPLGVATIFADGFESGYTTAWSAAVP